MEEIIPAMTNWLNLYYGNALYLVLAVFSYLYLFVHCKESKVRIIYPVLLIGFVVVNPILYNFIFSKIIYWRLFWMLPNAIVIACAIVGMLKNSNKKLERVLILGVFVLFVVVKGTDVYKNGGFVQAQNPYKVSQDVIEVCDAIMKLDDNPKCLMPATLFCEVRQYSGEIRLMYGRDVLGYISEITSDQWRSYHQMEGFDTNYDYLLGKAKLDGYNVVVTYESMPIEGDILTKYGYKKLQKKSTYCIYYTEEINNSGCMITQYGEAGASPSTFYTLVNSENELVIIDGGGTNNTEWVKKVLNDHGNRVAAWILTQPHVDHVGAFCEIMNEENHIVIEQIFVPELNEESQYKFQDVNNLAVYESFCNTIEKCNNVTRVEEGERYDLIGLRLDIISTMQADLKVINEEILADGSLSFIVSGSKESMLFCSDVSEEIERKVKLNSIVDGNVKYIQVAKHGDGGPSNQFYHQFNLEGAFFDTPNRMFDPYHKYDEVIELKTYFDTREILIYSFSTLINRVVIK